MTTSHHFLPYLLLLPLILLAAGIQSRQLTDSSPALISDGGEDSSSSSIIRMKTGDVGTVCEQLYGFLPCSESLGGHLFLILVYEYLLFHGESYVASGGERIFKILGPGAFGASAFQVIGSLPEALILLASGLWSSDETAQECMVTGIGLLAGSTILLLTLIWGTCVLLATQKFPSTAHLDLDSQKKLNPLENVFFSTWPGYGVLTDCGTSYTARIMLLSVVPLALVQVPGILGFSPAAKRYFLLAVLIVSILFLLSYFFYQFFEPWIQKRRLLYIKHEHLVIDILKHVQNQTQGTLLTDNGSPNVSTIKRLFDERDEDRDKVISFHELKQFLKEIKFRQAASSDDEATTAQMMADFDVDSDDKITMDEFVTGMTKWLDDTKDAMSKRLHSVKSLKDMYEVLRPWIEKKREEREMMRHLIPDLLQHLQDSVYGSLLTPDGAPDLPAIKRLFNDVDLDKDNYLSFSEVKELISSMKMGIIPYDSNTAAAKIMEELDINSDHLITEEEFVAGLSKWLGTMYNKHKPQESEGDDDDYQKTWEQTDKLIEDKFVDKSPLAWGKAIALVAVGIVMLGLLAEPLTRSVRDFSSASNLPSFYVAFVFVPLATNARLAFSAISEARKKKLHTNSLTLSEIYGTAFMNNVLGLIVLLSLISFRGINWDFSTEVVMVLAVSGVMGLLGSFSVVFPVWTAFFAYLLYPLSLILVYFLGKFEWLY